jgi:cytochrome c-type biogenesis protein CcmH
VIRAPSRTAIRTAIRLAALAILIATLAAPAAAAASTQRPRASLTDIENDVMCTSCRESLAVAQSPQAYSERSYIRKLIAEGLTKAQIEQNLVAQYGTAVLARPPASGFNLTVYVLPPAILAAGIAVLLVTLPRWRRRTRAALNPPDEDLPPLDPAEAERLEDELSRFRG